MRSTALFTRIVQQFFRDKRTLALLIIAPLFVLTLLSLVFNGSTYHPKISVIGAPQTVVQAFKDADATLINQTKLEAMNELKNNQLDALITFDGMKPSITLEGSSFANNRAVLLTANQALRSLMPVSGNVEPDIHYVHGGSDLNTFDSFGPVFIGFFAFFFVFLIAGVSFLRERTTGTLERLLSTPLKRSEIVIGYVLGFGFFTAIQTIIIVTYSVYVLNLWMAGSFWLVLLTTMLTSFTALTLGTLLSAFANNELQMIQFIPLVIVPQFFFSGVFNLDTISKWISWIGPLTPLYYAADALKGVMLRGYGWDKIGIDVFVLFGFGLVFMFLNVLALRKHRRI